MSGPRFVLIFGIITFLLDGNFLSSFLCHAASDSKMDLIETKKRSEVMETVKRLADEGFSLLNTGQFEAAVEKYKSALVLAQDTQDVSTMASLFSLLGSAYVNLRRWQEAAEVYEQTIRLRPDDAGTQETLGLMYSELGRHQEAIKAHQEAIRLKPDFVEAYHGLGLTYKKLGRYQDAIEAFQKAIRLKPDFVFSHIELGATYVEMFENEGRRYESSGQIDQAIEQYRVALEKCQVALEYAKALQHEGGLQYLSTLAGGLLINLGSLSGKKGQFQEAANFYRQAAQFNQEIGNITTANTLSMYVTMQEGFDRLKTADSHLQEGKNQDAIQAFSDAANIFKQVGNVGLAVGALNRIAQIYEERLKDNENALTYYEQALELCQQKDLSLEAQIRQSIGNLFVAMNQGKKALPFLKRAAELHEATNHLLPAFGALFALGSIYQKNGQPDQALEIFEKALLISQKLESSLSQEMKSPHSHFKGMMFGFIGKAQEDLGQVEKAIESYRQSSASFHEAGNKDSELFAFIASGRMLFRLGRYQDASAAYERAWKIAKELKDVKAELVALNSLGLLADVQGNLDQSEKYLLLARDLCQQNRDFRQAADLSVRVGRTHQDIGHYDKALNFYYQALSTYREAKDQSGEGRTLAEIGEMYRGIGDFNAAEQWSKDAVEKSHVARDIVGELQALSTLIIIEAYGGDDSALKNHISQATKISLELHSSTNEMVSVYESQAPAFLNNLGGEDFKAYEKAIGGLIATVAEIGRQKKLKLAPVSFEEVAVKADLVQSLGQSVALWGNQPELAIPPLTASLVFHKKSQARSYAHKAVKDLYLIGKAYSRMGKYDEALKAAQEAEAIARASDSPIIWQVWSVKGEVAEKQGRLDDAILNYTQAVDAVETMSFQQRLEELKLPLREGVTRIYQSLVRLLIQEHSEKEKPQHVEKAFLYHEKGKARTLLDLLEESRVRVREGIDLSLLNEEEKIIASISGVRRTLATPTHPKDYENALLSTLKEQEQTLHALRVKMAVANQKYASLRSSQIATIPQIQAILDEKTLLLEYALGEEKSFLFGITKEEVQTYELPTETEISDMVKQYMSSGQRLEPYFKDRWPLSASESEIARQIVMGEKLYEILLRPAIGQMQKRSKLIIVLDAALYYLPFETLLTDDGSSSKKDGQQPKFQQLPYLVKDYTVTYVPSASVLVALEKDQNARLRENSSQAPLLAFGDPSPMPNGFDRLLHSAEEVQKIAEIVGVTMPSDAVNLQEKATKKRLREIDLSHYGMLHFATHAVLSEPGQLITQPSLVLSSAGTDNPHDSFLQMGEIFNLRLNAQLVVLSACHTGRGKSYRGEGFVGLTRAFMYAGTSSLVASLWRVSDESTSRFMEFFYRNLKEGRPKAEALRLAKIELMQTLVWNDQSQDEFPKFQSPYFWAPFILMGSGN